MKISFEWGTDSLVAAIFKLLCKTNVSDWDYSAIYMLEKYNHQVQ